MKLNLYNAQDVLIGFGSSPWGAETDEIAIRNYLDFLSSARHPEDMRLFRVGSIDTETGEISPETPKCIQGGGEPRKEDLNG